MNEYLPPAKQLAVMQTGPEQPAAPQRTEYELTDEKLRSQLPRPELPGFDMGRGDEEPPETQTYGRRRIVARLEVRPGRSRAVIEAMLAERGVKYSQLYPTRRYWCAVVFE